MGWISIDVIVAGSPGVAFGNKEMRLNPGRSPALLLKYYIPNQSTFVSGGSDVVIQEILGDEAYNTLFTITNPNTSLVNAPFVRPAKILDYDGTGTVGTTLGFTEITGLNIAVAQANAGTVRVWVLVDDR